MGPSRSCLETATALVGTSALTSGRPGGSTSSKFRDRPVSCVCNRDLEHRSNHDLPRPLSTSSTYLSRTCLPRWYLGSTASDGPHLRTWQVRFWHAGTAGIAVAVGVDDLRRHLVSTKASPTPRSTPRLAAAKGQVPVFLLRSSDTSALWHHLVWRLWTDMEKQIQPKKTLIFDFLAWSHAHVNWSTRGCDCHVSLLCMYCGAKSYY